MAWIILTVFVVVFTAVLVIANVRWQAKTEDLAARAGASLAGAPAFFNISELEGLPEPVQRYFRAVLPEGRPVIRRARLKQDGEFLVRPESNRWIPFRAEQTVGVNPAVFVWDARMAMVPGIDIRVRDAFAAGHGSMHASILALIPLVTAEGTPGIAVGALQRYLAEAAWFPTALLPSQGVSWTAIDASSARATLDTSGVKVSLVFRFGDDGLIRSAYAPDRPRSVGGREVPTPWEGRWLEYGILGEMRVPVRGEVAWLLPEGRQVYWKGRITEALYESCRSGGT
ncbi:MAG: hypothetical protein HPY65_14645 [Syntrophaceae bacterium]|nr:hypothetical protein [Syntrophaceae bacterium]